MEATTITWRPDCYKDAPLCKSDWCDKLGWDFVGAVVDIQLRHALLDEGIGDWAGGEYFWVKYTGTIEGFEENVDAPNQGEKVNYHFGVDKFSKRLYIFRDVNICDIRNPNAKGRVEELMENVEKAGYDAHINPSCWGCA